MQLTGVGRFKLGGLYRDPLDSIHVVPEEEPPGSWPCNDVNVQQSTFPIIGSVQPILNVGYFHLSNGSYVPLRTFNVRVPIYASIISSDHKDGWLQLGATARRFSDCGASV